jgi:hypothetical protein
MTGTQDQRYGEWSGLQRLDSVGRIAFGEPVEHARVEKALSMKRSHDLLRQYSPEVTQDGAHAAQIVATTYVLKSEEAARMEAVRISQFQGR